MQNAIISHRPQRKPISWEEIQTGIPIKWNKSNGKPPNRKNITQSAPLIDETPPLIHRTTPSIQETTLAIGVLTEKCQQIQRETPENLYCPSIREHVPEA